MIKFPSKSAVVLLVAMVLGYRYTASDTKSYRDNLNTWRDPSINFLTPQPMDQSMLYKTVSEIVDPVPAQIVGEIPAWLSGTLLRDGPELFEFGELYLLFDLRYYPDHRVWCGVLTGNKSISVKMDNRP